MTTKRRTALYLRVSTEDQVDKYGLDVQRDELSKAVSKRGLDVVGTFVDEGVTGESLSRPQLDKMLALVRAGAIDVVLTMVPDRLARKSMYQGVLMQDIERHGARVDFAKFEHDGSPESNMLVQMLGSFAEYEKAKTLFLTQMGRGRRAREGKVLYYPFGYRKSDDGTIVVHESEAEIVRLMYRRALIDKRSLRQIALELSDELRVKPPRGGRWQSATVRKMLTNTFYGGRTHYNRTRSKSIDGVRQPFDVRDKSEWITLTVPAIVALDLVEQARERFERNRRELSGRPTSNVYLLSGLLRCGECGWSLAVNGTRYRCAGRYHHANPTVCSLPSLSRQQTDRDVWEAIIAVMRNPKLLDEKYQATRDSDGVRQLETSTSVAYLKRELREVEKEQRTLVGLFSKTKGSSQDVVADKLNGLSAQHAELSARLQQAEQSEREAVTTAHDRESQQRACARLLRKLGTLDDPADRRELLRLAVTTITVKPDALSVRGVLPLDVPSSPVHPQTSRGSSAQKHTASESARPYLLTLPVGSSS